MQPEQPPSFRWLRYARADLALARGPLPPDSLYEMLCSHAQQAVEKALKALLIAHEMTPPRTHDLLILLQCLPELTVIPDHVKEAVGLTEYAVSTRYPDDMDILIEAEEYRTALALAEMTVRWVEEIIRNRVSN